MTIAELKNQLIAKIQRKLQFNSPDVDYDTEYISDLIDDACLIITKWRKLSADSTEITDGMYNNEICTYVIESIVMAGVEGQKSSNANGVSKSFYNTPEANLKSAIKQVIA
jgi:hypothetical protein